MSLRDLALKLAAFEAAIVDGESAELPVAVEDSLAIKDKVDAYGFVLNRLEAIESEYKARADKLSQIAKRLSAAQEQMKQNLKDAMEILGVDEIQGDERRFKLQSAKASVKLVEPGLVPDKFWKTEIVKSLDKEMVSKSPEPVPGTEIVKTKYVREYAVKPGAK
ncbi:siphovirus Gp157 family protein [Microcystis sp. M061S2]|uniref:siphovirus Gp157 family protein n=1 Tax=Microcystis sp. M061S2 TaxID=2771171 RepID=UPI002589EA5C|nr:siphovirus Gp157 family protein [Microcystis sp. M061S2]MCA2654521.1 siphovirus Gp157 family protein [Microcystis sp. M061S2]